MKKELKILFLNSTDDLLNITVNKLSDWNYNVSFKQVKSCQEILKSIKGDDWNFAICEMNTNTSLLNILKMIKCTYKYLPIIIISDELNEEHALKLIKVGIIDYIPKNEIYRLRQTIYKIYKLSSANHKNLHYSSDNDTSSGVVSDERLSFNENQYASLINNMTEAFLYAKVVCDDLGNPIDYIVLEINRAFEEMTGYKRTDILGKKVSEVNPYILNSRPNLIEICGHTALYGERKRYELFMDHDKKVYLISTFSPRTNYFVNICSDITEQKKVEIELQRMNIALEQSPAIVIITDANGYVEYVNPRFQTVTGYSCQEVSGRHIELIESGKMPASKNEEMWQKIRNGEVWVGEFLNKTKSGKLFWVSASISPVRNSSGIITSYISIQEDITEKKIMHQDIIDKNKKLKKAMKDIKKMQEHIIIQEKLAGIGLLASGIAHEINNPLGFIISNIDILNKYVMDINEMLQVYKSLLSNINRNKYIWHLEQIEQIERSINLDYVLGDIPTIFDECNNGLRRISSIVKGLNSNVTFDQQNIYCDYNINTGIENVLLFLNRQNKHVEIRKELVNVPNINVVPEKIEQVLLNVIMNAIQAISIKKSLENGLIIIRTYHDKKYIHCEIEDNGIGIPKENIKKVFNPFYTSKPVGEGTGLGLSISYDIIVNLHGGLITVKSEFGKGSTFSIKLPLCPKERIDVTK